VLLLLPLGEVALPAAEGEVQGGGGDAFDGGGTAAAAASPTEPENAELVLKEPDAEEGLLLGGEAAGEGAAVAPADRGIVRDWEERRFDGGEALGEPAGPPARSANALGVAPPLLPPVIAAACLTACPVRGPTDSGFLLPSRLRREDAFTGACTGTGGWRAPSLEEEARLGGGEEEVLNAAEDCCALVLPALAETPTARGVLDRRGGDAAGDEGAWFWPGAQVDVGAGVGVGDRESGGVAEEEEEEGEQSPPGDCAPAAAADGGFHGRCNKLPPASLSYTSRPWKGKMKNERGNSNK